MRKAHVSGGTERYRTDATIGPHRVLLDEPVEDGGADLGPTPREALLGALGACTSVTVRLYAARKGMKLERVDVDLELDSTPGQKARIKKKITIVGELTADERKRLEQIAERCPINRMLLEGTEIATEFG